MSDIFISYASQDRERAKPLAEMLATQGWSVWWDREIPSGRPFDQVIEEELGNARCVVVAWSINAIESRYVKDEAKSGIERNILIPILLDNVTPPLGFRHVQTADLQRWNGTSAHPDFQKLVRDISSYLGPASPTEGHVKQGAEEIPILPQQSKSTVADQFTINGKFLYSVFGASAILIAIALSGERHEFPRGVFLALIGGLMISGICGTIGLVIGGTIGAVIGGTISWVENEVQNGSRLRIISRVQGGVRDGGKLGCFFGLLIGCLVGIILSFTVDVD